MCHRANNEPLLQYWFRQFREEPLRVLILAFMAALVWLYQDNREDSKHANNALVEQIKESTGVMAEIKAQLILLNGRVEHLEREHEAARNK
ncbi:MAG: hypothetical protein IJA81_09160 [Akkermansia sp.]|nr:hypothetical protein [Akkermansia sp.]